MYKSLEEICEMTTKEGKPFWKIVQEDDCREQGISEGKAFEQMLDDLDKAIAGLQAMGKDEKVSLATYDTWGVRR